MYAEVIIDITHEAVNRSFTYRIPEGMDIKAGDRVSIPFGNLKRNKTGYVVAIKEKANFPDSKIKDIKGIAKKSISANEDLIDLAIWMAGEYSCTINQCLKTALPVKRKVGKNSRREDPLKIYENEEDLRHILNTEQLNAIKNIVNGMNFCDIRKKEIKSGKYLPPSYLIYGITGSGKTEVYLNIMEEVLRRGKDIILLIPEISLSYQTVRRVYTRFKGRVSILNSRMSEGERYEQYESARKANVNIMVGPRSAVFAPFKNIGLIIIDEEHEPSYKSSQAPRYDVRDVALRRCMEFACPLVLGSATPSLETYRRARAGRMGLVELKNRAKEGSIPAKTEIVDLREELKSGNLSIFSRRLTYLTNEALSKGQQVMFFINRRGYSNFINCRSCGKTIKCPHCDVSLTLHRDGKLKCHYCAYETYAPKTCPSCGSKYIAPFGIGTQQLEEMAKETFKGARVLRMDADTTGKKNSHEKILCAFREHKADILIGTQMIVKGHDFPMVTVVGIIAADLSLSFPDFKAGERTFQLITQAAGRAGRGKDIGHVVIQTYQPEDNVINAAALQNFEAFYEEEIIFRNLLGYPPSKIMLSVMLESGDEDILTVISEKVKNEIEGICARENAEFTGPLEAGIYKLKDIFRKIIYIKHDSHDIILHLRDEIDEIIKENDKRNMITVSFDFE